MYWSESAKPLTRLPLHRGASATWSPPIHPRVSANLKLRTFRKATFSPNFAVELCEAFHCERCFPELHSQQSLMPMLPSTETSSRLNGMSNVSHSLPYLIRSLEFMATECGTFSNISRTFPFQSDSFEIDKVLLVLFFQEKYITLRLLVLFFQEKDTPVPPYLRKPSPVISPRTCRGSRPKVCRRRTHRGLPPRSARRASANRICRCRIRTHACAHSRA